MSVFKAFFPATALIIAALNSLSSVIPDVDLSVFFTALKIFLVSMLLFISRDEKVVATVGAKIAATVIVSSIALF